MLRDGGSTKKGTIVSVQNMSMPHIDRDFNSNYVDLDLSRDTISKFLNMNAHFENVWTWMTLRVKVEKQQCVLLLLE
jgi:hypothetical protein